LGLKNGLFAESPFPHSPPHPLFSPLFGLANYREKANYDFHSWVSINIGGGNKKSKERSKKKSQKFLYT
jgi:hypothetical protein